VIARSMVYLVLVGSVAVFYSAAITLLSYIFVDSSKVSPISLIASLVVTLFIASTFQYLRKFIDKLTNRIFFQDTYEQPEVLNHLSQLTASTIDLNRILQQSKILFEQTLKSSYCSFILVDKEGNITHMSDDIRGSQEELKHLTSLVPRTHSPIIAELVNESGKQYQLLQSLSAELVFPLYTTEGVFGILVMGTKQNGKEYVQKDIQLLTISTSSLSVAIQNALRYEEIERFNETLQKEIESATRQLRETNLKLRKVDKQKDEFIGMASHQLRTPLTSIKGYVSLVLDGDAGRITATQRKLLEQAFTSSQRMVYLIADLLNVSRLKSGKFVIERVSTNLSKMITDELAQLRTAASSHDITLSFTPPESFPTLMLDETKTRQVVMNFLDNAIYYTPKGGHINVILRDLPKSIEFEVVDDGIGVPDDERHHLFTKFYRAKNAQRARPDGTGLGLFMAKKVIIAQGGALIFDSKEGVGSKFGFSFPKEMPVDTTQSAVVRE
jgi:signal transduction histidine kinase